MTTIGFTGHRDRLSNPGSLRRLEERYPGATWVHGGAIGFDSQVDAIARELGKVEGETLIVIRPDYKQYRPTVAPLIRNRQIVDMSDFVVACFDGRKKGGTRQCTDYARDVGKRVEFVTPIETEKVS